MIEVLNLAVHIADLIMCLVVIILSVLEDRDTSRRIKDEIERNSKNN